MPNDLLTEAELNAIRAREQAATPGPWTVSEGHELEHSSYDMSKIEIGSPQSHVMIGNFCHEVVMAYSIIGPSQSLADSTFGAEARQDIPRLLAHIAELSEAMETLRAERDDAIDIVSSLNGDCEQLKQRHDDMRERYRELGGATDGMDM